MKIISNIKFAFLLCTLSISVVHAQFTAELYNGDITVNLSAEPEVIDPARDLILTITVTAPSGLQAILPDLQDRFQGFSMAEDFTSEPIEAGGQIMINQRWKLTPKPAAERYRLAPFAIAVKDSTSTSEHRFSFATKPVLFPKGEARPSVTGEPEIELKPIWIAPTAKTITLWIFAVIGAILAIAGILYGLTKISAKVKEFRMSPIERALTELDRLLHRDLPGKGKFKDFYVELTMVVRRYIERSHNVRAPEQTTEEFLAAAEKHPDFTSEVLAQLKIFLESADLVKFAGQKADLSMAEDATQKARRYMNSDAETLSSLTDKTKTHDL